MSKSGIAGRYSRASVSLVGPEPFLVPRQIDQESVTSTPILGIGNKETAYGDATAPTFGRRDVDHAAQSADRAAEIATQSFA
jgi:hypothetical protein